MEQILKYIFLIFISISIASCGFQFRGSDKLNFETISIVGGSPKFVKSLKKRFKQSKVRIETKNAQKNLEITDDTFSKKILSLSSSGKVKEYQITYKVTFRIKPKDGEWGELIAIETIRDYTYDDKNIIAKTEEESRLIEGMQEQLIRTIVTRISVSK
ncbi:LPS assembly lipoprotein LptE [Nitrosomonadales bacterium]|nr:LPS assembly lipoprotein LptE [Nitrosomonadales bacterium]